MHHGGGDGGVGGGGGGGDGGTGGRFDLIIAGHGAAPAVFAHTAPHVAVVCAGGALL